MQRETNEHIKKIVIAINNILKANQIPTTPQNVVKYTISTILSLLENQDVDNVKDLLSVLFVYQDFLQEDLNELLCKLIDYGFEDKAFRIIKILLNSGRDVYIGILLKYYLGGVNKSKMFNMINFCFEKCEKNEIILKSINKAMEKNEEIENLRIFNTFFDKIYPHIEFKDMITKSIDFAHHNTNIEVREEYWKVILGVLYKYVVWLSEVDKDLNFFTNEMKYILNILKKTEEYAFIQSSLVLRIVGKIVELDKIYYYKLNMNIIEIDKSFKKLIKGLIFYEETTYKSIEEFFTEAKHLIIPDFIDITRELCDKFNKEPQDKLVPILRIIACHIGIFELNSIMNDQMDYTKWIPILTSTSNNDLSIFIEIYNRVEEKDKMYTLIPAFCNYATDNQDKIDVFLNIIIECLNNKLYYGLACNGIRNLIASHEMNLNKTCILRHQIDKEVSKRILDRVCSMKMFFGILRNYGNEQLPKEVLFLISRKLEDAEMNRIANLFIEYITRYPEHSSMIIQGIAVSDIKECINFSKFFIPFMKLSIDFPSKVLEFCSSENVQVQKKAYELLYYLEKEGKIEMCVCEHINSKDLLNCLKSSSLKYKLLYLNVLRNCNCGVNKRDFLFQNVIMSFSSRGNISSRRVSEDIISNIFLGSDIDTIPYFIEFAMKGLRSNNLEITSGCLSTLNFILQRYNTSITYEIQKSVYSFVCESYKSVNALVIIKILSTFIKYTENVIDENVVKILEYYVEIKKRKYRSDIKEVVHLLMKKELRVSRSLKKYTNFRIPTNKQTLTITKNNEIIISEDTKNN